ncbi:MAG: GNAT family N-acetyltransferase [Dehalococcoidia bacterium]|nr:GNAT family N-acetyltransferase [Dehalococcoidia bacterium]MYA53557.1 GNAT family N-acetyltransferase [Dehalococcoidia bacterium]
MPSPPRRASPAPASSASRRPVSPVEIADLSPDDEEAIAQIARIIVEAFRDHTPSWPDLPSAEAEVRESFGEDRLSRVARDGGVVVGWVGGISEYDGHAWELHPLAVDPARQGEGIGRALVADLEQQVAALGATTLYLGTDDEDGRTSLSDTDIYPDPLAPLAAISNPGRHPYEFYLSCGFSLVGVIPDANGPGKPDILMAKRIAKD